MLIGFPVVPKTGGPAHAVWVNVARTAAGGALFTFNDGDSQPLLNRNTALRTAVGAITDSGCLVRFTQDGRDAAGDEPPAIQGNSWMVCLRLLSKHGPKPKGEDGRFLISASIMPDGRSLAPLKSNETTLKKAKMAVESGYVLFLHQDDTKDLGEGIPVYSLDDFNAARKVHTAGQKELRCFRNFTFPHWCSSKVEQGGRGFVFSIPLGEGGLTEQTVKGLVDLLQLEKRAARTSALEESDQTFGDFFRKVLPSLSESHFSAFMGSNENQLVAEWKLFKEGMLHNAMEHNTAKALFAKEDANPPTRNILLGGPTGCGKTVLATVLIMNEILENDGSAIYVAPTRMLAQEVYSKFCGMLPEANATGKSFPINKKEDVILSTGEDSDDDYRIRNGDFKAAFIISEKANLFLQQGTGLSKSISLIVADEIHMITDNIRGGVLDLLLAKAKRIMEDHPDKQFRIVAITTENVASEMGMRNYFTLPTTLRAEMEKTEPVTLTSHKRPVPVDHYIQPYVKGKSYEPVLITRFEDNTNIVMSSAARRQVRETIENQHGGSEPFPNRTDLILKHLKGHSKAIICDRGADAIFDIISRLINHDRFPEGSIKGPDKEVDLETKLDELNALLHKGNIASEEMDKILRGAKHGIFVHYSDLDYDIRRWMEKAFKTLRSTSEYPLILCATETLAYGVNLPADCLLLMDILWHREDPITGEQDSKPLTHNQYHNLLGRVGRYGHCDMEIPNKVVVFAPFENNKRIKAILDQYQEAKPMEPGTFLQKDLNRVDRKELEEAGLDSMSYSAFRSTMDALRFADAGVNGATSAELRSIIRNTYLWSYWMLRNKGDVGINGVMNAILALACKMEPKIVDKTSDQPSPRYRLRGEGEALIDTGTKPQSVAPMQAWLKRIRWETTEKTPPVEFLLPALVASPDLWNLMRSFCKEVDIKMATALEGGNKEAAEILQEELEKLGPATSPDLNRLFIETLIDFIDKDCSRLVVNEKTNDYRRIIFLKVTAALLKWIRGEDLDDINTLSLESRKKAGQEGHVKRTFKEKYNYKASWLAAMCLRFFSKIDNSLLPHHERELPRLAMRLKLGVPAFGLPYMRKMDMTRILTRSQALEMINKGFIPRSIICTDEPVEFLLSEAPLEKFMPPSANPVLLTERRTIKKQLAENIVKTVFNYFVHGGERLFSVLQRRDSPESQEHWSSLTTYLKDLKGSLSMPDLREVVRDSLVSGVCGLSGRGETKAMKTHAKITVSQGKASFVLGVYGAKEKIPDEHYNLIARIPWPVKKPERFVELTLFSAVTICVMIRREFLDMGTVLEWSKIKKPGYYTLRDILAEMPDYKQSLPGEILEILLSLDEPEFDD